MSGPQRALKCEPEKLGRSSVLGGRKRHAQGNEICGDCAPVPRSGSRRFALIVALVRRLRVERRRWAAAPQPSPRTRAAVARGPPAAGYQGHGRHRCCLRPVKAAASAGQDGYRSEPRARADGEDCRRSGRSLPRPGVRRRQRQAQAANGRPASGSTPVSRRTPPNHHRLAGRGKMISQLQRSSCTRSVCKPAQLFRDSDSGNVITLSRIPR